MPRAAHPRVLTVSPKELLVLELLTQDDEQYGLQLVAASRGALKKGTIYVTLGRMEEKGYVSSTLDDAPPEMGGLPRRRYAITALGRRMRRVWTSGAARLVPELAK